MEYEKGVTAVCFTEASDKPASIFVTSTHLLTISNPKYSVAPTFDQTRSNNKKCQIEQSADRDKR